jgi:3-oxoacyl-[acyl-carrier protein] reductase
MGAELSYGLAGRRAIVTGHRGGIGGAIHDVLTRDGVQVIGLDLPDFDLSDTATLEPRLAALIAERGPIDILVNNAGVYAFSPIESLTEDEFHRHFNINVLGVLLSIREALKHFATNGGSIINISSVVSRLAPPQNALYVASKSAVDGITRSLAKELGPRHIRVNAINPGVVETEGTHAGGIIGSEFERQAAQQAPLGRTGQPADIAAVAVFLASDDARWLTGEMLFASGGL